ncbi:MAG: GtrA family protein [Nanoarchaeota archaeon]
MNILKKFIGFCMVGGTGALLELLIFNIFYSFGIIFQISKLLAILFSISFVFIINRNFIFNARNKRFYYQIPRYLLVYSFVFLVNFCVSLLVNSLLGDGTFYANIAAISGIIAGIPLSFLGSLLWTFK